MKLISAFLLLTGTLATVEASDTGLRGSMSVFLGGWGQLKCSVEAFSDAEKCAAAVNAENEPCSFCTIEDPNGGEATGLCVDPVVAPQMEQLNPSIDCTSGSSSSEDTIAIEAEEEEINVGIDYHDFKCSIKAFNDPHLCKHTKTDGGEENCEYCTVNGPFGESGICVSPEHAAALEGYNPDVKCDGDEDRAKKRTSFKIAPKHVGGWGKLKCSLNFADDVKCAETTNDEGQPCSFCTIEGLLSDDEYGAGVCVDPSITSQMESMNSDMICDNDIYYEYDSGEEEEMEVLDYFVDYYDFKCTIKAFVDPDICAQTKIGGENCQYCHIDGQFGEKGLCMSPDHVEYMEDVVGNSMKCDETISIEHHTDADDVRSPIAAYA